MFEPDSWRWTQAGLSLLAYAALWAHGRRRGRQTPPPQAGAGFCVAHASQSGQAAALAQQTAAALRAAGWPVQTVSLGRLALEQLGPDTRLLVVASTQGDGDAPDEAQALDRRCRVGPPPALAGLRYGVLALGDRGYPRFCAFGRRLDDWLQAGGARPLFPRIEADRLAPAALQQWQAALAPWIAGTLRTDTDEPAGPWRVVARQVLDAGDDAAPLVQLDLQPLAPDRLHAAAWQAGDLVAVTGAADGVPRCYSIASLPTEGCLRLWVRRRQRPDGQAGAVSGWLTGLPVGATLPLRLRPHPGFRIGPNADRPLLLIGAGSGYAGLRAHLMARLHGAAAPVWLLFGERHARARDWLQADLAAASASGRLAHADLVWSRAGTGPRHVQQRLLEQADRLADWVRDGAAVYVCGRRDGLGDGVQASLQAVLGDAGWQRLLAEGRLRRDLY